LAAYREQKVGVARAAFFMLLEGGAYRWSNHAGSSLQGGDAGAERAEEPDAGVKEEDVHMQLIRLEEQADHNATFKRCCSSVVLLCFLVERFLGLEGVIRFYERCKTEN
jgi:hypothetical protein